MSLEKIIVSHFRNIQEASLLFHPRFNLIYGDNGSGKTSLLESIYYLSLGRSFRTHHHHRVISSEKEKFSIFGHLNNDISLGIEKKRDGKGRIRIDGDNCLSAAELAKHLPVQVINPDTYKLLTGGPKERRQFIDWGVFHVKHSFLSSWQRVQTALKQRNSALRQGLSRQQISAWDSDLMLMGNKIDGMRDNYLKQFTKLFTDLFTELWDFEVTLSYYRGWNRDKSYEDILKTSFDRDIQLGYTQFGPQRAELRITINNMPAADFLSRGQQKVLVSCLRLAQGALLKQINQKQCIYLIDDIAAELDEKKNIAMMQLLDKLQAQVFITAVSQKDLEFVSHFSENRLFHVEHGKVMTLENSLVETV